MQRMNDASVYDRCKAGSDLGHPPQLIPRRGKLPLCPPSLDLFPKGIFRVLGRFPADDEVSTSTPKSIPQILHSETCAGSKGTIDMHEGVRRGKREQDHTGQGECL